MFEFDYDLTWAGFFLNADEHVYGRYGGRDGTSADSRMSLTGLKFSLEQAAKAHQNPPKATPRPKAIRAEDFAAARRFKGGCIHCHQVKEFERADLKLQGKWDPELRWSYPLPENIGLSLDVDRGNRVWRVMENSPAAKAGLKRGDVVQRINNISIASTADAQYALHKAPAQGEIPVTWSSDGKEQSDKLTLANGWRKTNLTWRPSMLDILASFPFSGGDAKADEKKQLGLPETQAVLKQDKFVHSTLKMAGFQQGDLFVGVNGKSIDGKMEDYLGHLRREYLVGDTVKFNILRDGKAMEIAYTFK